MAKTKKPKAKGEEKVTLYCYVSPSNAEFAKYYGRKKFGSFSEYVDRLISNDRHQNKRHVKLPTEEGQIE